MSATGKEQHSDKEVDVIGSVTARLAVSQRSRR